MLSSTLVCRWSNSANHFRIDFFPLFGEDFTHPNRWFLVANSAPSMMTSQVNLMNQPRWVHRIVSYHPFDPNIFAKRFYLETFYISHILGSSGAIVIWIHTNPLISRSQLNQVTFDTMVCHGQHGTCGADSDKSRRWTIKKRLAQKQSLQCSDSRWFWMLFISPLIGGMIQFWARCFQLGLNQ